MTTVEDRTRPDPKHRRLPEVRALRETIRDRVAARVTAHGWARTSSQEATR